jgi:hypothetical protein
MPCPGRDDDRLETAQLDGGLAVRAGDGPVDPVELVVERGVVDPRRRCDVGSEDADLDASEAAQRAQSRALTARIVHGGAPVDLDAEGGRPEAPLAPGCAERDRDAGERVRPSLEQRPRLGGLHASDVDAGDAHAFGDARRRPGEGQAEQRADGAEERDGDERALPDQPRAAATTTRPDRMARTCLRAQGRQSNGVSGTPRWPDRLPRAPSSLAPVDAAIVVDELDPAAVRVADEEALRLRRVVHRLARQHAHPARPLEHVVEAGRVDVECELVGVARRPGARGAEEDEQDRPDAERVVRAVERLGAEELLVEGLQPGGIRAAEGDVVDPEDGDQTPLPRSCKVGTVPPPTRAIFPDRLERGRERANPVSRARVTTR